jgi:hypothetical protein
MRLYDAYRRGYITYDQYTEYLDSGLTPDSLYAPPVPDPVPPVPDPENGETTNFETLVYTLDVNTVTAHSVSIENTGGTYPMNFRVDRLVGETVVNSIADNIIPGDVFYVNFATAVDTIEVYVWNKETDHSTTYTVGGSVTY